PRVEAPPAGKLAGTLITARDTGEEIIVRSGDGERLRLPGDAVDLTVSPDGKWLAWRQSGEYLVSDLDGGKPRTVAEAPDACQAPAWAPDREPLLLTGAADGDIAWHDIESGDTVSKLDTDRERGSALCRVFPVSIDEGYDVYYGTGGPFEIRYLSPDGSFTNTGVMKKLRDRGDWESLTGLSPDGKRACVR
ncbi:MAG: TolB family protein, partial [Stackebrandtia sp.]